MDTREKALYHQIHPGKLATDISSAVVSLYLFWNQELALGLIVNFVPAVIGSAIILRYADLERIEKSAAGAYLRRFMTRTVQGIRFAANVLMIVGAWYHELWLILAGLAVVLVAWFHGFFLPGRTKPE